MNHNKQEENVQRELNIQENRGGSILRGKKTMRSNQTQDSEEEDIISKSSLPKTKSGNNSPVKFNRDLIS